jgi:hypothetical protein
MPPAADARTTVPTPPAAPATSTVQMPVPPPSPAAVPPPSAPGPAHPPLALVDPTRSIVHLGASYPGAWLELRSTVDEGGWRKACMAPCDRSLAVAGTVARVSAPGMTTSNTFRIEPGAGRALIRVDGGSAEVRFFGILSLGIGIPTLLTGGTLYSYGKFSDREGLRDVGAVVLGVGVLAVLASLPLLFTGGTKVRDARGSVIAKAREGAPAAL